MTKKITLLICALLIGSCWYINGIRMGPGKKPSYKFLQDLKEAADTFTKDIQKKATPSPENLITLNTLSQRIKNMYKDLFLNPTPKELMPEKTEPPALAFISFGLQEKILDELKEITTEVKNNLEKVRNRQPTPQLHQDIDDLRMILGKVDDQLQYAKNARKEIDTVSSYERIKKYYDEVALWARYDKARLPPDNQFLTTLPPDVTKDLLHDKKTVLHHLKARLTFVKPRTAEINILANLLDVELQTIEQNLKALTPQAAASLKELQESLVILSVNLHALQSHMKGV